MKVVISRMKNYKNRYNNYRKRMAINKYKIM